MDDRPNLRPGAKYFEWEAKGVPLRVELGPRDAKAGVAVVVKRTGGDTEGFSLGLGCCTRGAVNFVFFNKALARFRCTSWYVLL